MDQYAILDYLSDLAGQLGMEIRQSPPERDPSGRPAGAIVRLRNRFIIFLDPSSPISDQISLLASALKGRAELDDRFIPPEVRQAMEN